MADERGDPRPKRRTTRSSQKSKSVEISVSSSDVIGFVKLKIYEVLEDDNALPPCQVTFSILNFLTDYFICSIILFGPKICPESFI